MSSKNVSSENDRKRSRGNDEAGAAPASLADIESTLRQALGRIDSLEKENVAIRASMERETKALREDIKTLKEENKALTDAIDKLKDEDKALQWSLNRLAGRVRMSWEYPMNHCIQPDEYWLNRGIIDYDFISDLNEYCIGSIRSAVSELAHGVCNHVVGIGNSDSHSRFLHDAALIPHWYALSESFRGINPHGRGMKIFFENIELNEQVMGMICDNLRGKNIREVAFTRIHFTNVGAAILALRNMLLYSPQVKSLVWSEIPIDSVDDMALFTQMLSDRPVEELNFVLNGDGNAQALLEGADLSKYKRLRLRGNNLRTNGRADIPDLIASNSPLESLDLSSNNLNNDDAVLIAESLSRNTHLKNIILLYNNDKIQERGKNALLRALKDTSSMNALSDSNHTCNIAGLYLVATNMCGQLSRAFKIHSLLAERYHSGEGNVPYFNREMNDEDSVLLAPFIMESVHKRHAAIEKRHSYYVYGISVLGLLHELVKWKMSELFSFN